MLLALLWFKFDAERTEKMKKEIFKINVKLLNKLIDESYSQHTGWIYDYGKIRETI